MTPLMFKRELRNQLALLKAWAKDQNPDRGDKWLRGFIAGLNVVEQWVDMHGRLWGKHPLRKAAEAAAERISKYQVEVHTEGDFVTKWGDRA